MFFVKKKKHLFVELCCLFTELADGHVIDAVFTVPFFGQHKQSQVAYSKNKRIAKWKTTLLLLKL